MSESERFDAIVIGSGQAGPFLAARLVASGSRVALIEREHLGGTCVNDGCMPTKTLVACARAAHVVRTAASQGVLVEGPLRIDMNVVKARKDRVVGDAVRNLTTWLEGMTGLELIRGHARFLGAHTVAVAGRQLEAARIFINVGGRAVLPAWPGIEGIPVLTNSTVMDLETVPEHLVVAGGSYIGLEFAQIYRRFGARVSVIEVGDRLIGREDPDVSATVQAILEGEGIEFHLAARDVSVSPGAGGQGLQVTLRSGGTSQVIEGSHLLAAVGRRPNTDDLGLAAAGLATDARGFIPVDDQLRTQIDGIWALGDVNGRGAFTHTSYNDYEIVAANLLDGDPRKVSDRIPVYALFIDPPLARIGMSESEVRASGRPALIGTMAMARVGRAKERGETQGFMKVLVDAESERILGATLLGIEADEVIHLLLDIMYAGVSYKVIQRAVHIHPTVSELIPTVLGSLVPLTA